jgi:hypothetical protein
MFPDLADVRRVSRSLNLSQPAENIWPDTVIAFHFLKAATGACRNHGRHQFILIAELKATAEQFIGRSITDGSLEVAMKLLALEVKASKKDGQSLVKMPPLGRFAEKRDAWSQCQLDVEKQIAVEVQLMVERAAIQAKWAAEKQDEKVPPK